MDVISFSRDSMLPIQVFDASGKNLGWENQHLGLAFSYGETPEQGCMLTAEAVSRSMNSIPVIYYTAANISSITDFQNLVGPLTVTVPGDDLEYLGEELKRAPCLTWIHPMWKRFCAPAIPGNPIPTAAVWNGREHTSMPI